MTSDSWLTVDSYIRSCIAVTPISWQSAVSFIYQNRRTVYTRGATARHLTECLVRLAYIRSVKTSLLCSVGTAKFYSKIIAARPTSRPVYISRPNQLTLELHGSCSAAAGRSCRACYTAATVYLQPRLQPATVRQPRHVAVVRRCCKTFRSCPCIVHFQYTYTTATFCFGHVFKKFTDLTEFRY